MGDSTPFPNSAAIARAEVFTREQFVYEGEALEEALAPGSARRRALDAALAEVEDGAKQPSVQWRRSFSLLLGLERLLFEEEPHLVDGTVLSAHQVDALSGTLTALLAEAQRNGSSLNGLRLRRREWRRRARSAGIGLIRGGLWTEDDEREDLDLDDDLEEDEDGEIEDDDEDEEDEEPQDEEPPDWQEEDELDEDVELDEQVDDELDEDVELDEQPEDPNAARQVLV